MLTAYLYFFLVSFSAAFTVQRTARFPLLISLQAVRYGPDSRRMDPPSTDVFSNKKNSTAIPSEDNNISSDDTKNSLIASQKQAFERLVEQVMSATDPQHIPSTLTKNMDLLLSFDDSQQVATHIIQPILHEIRITEGDEAASRAEEAIDVILSCTEDFVKEAALMYDSHRNLLGILIKAISSRDNTSDDRERALETALRENKLTAGFVRHVTSECERIANAPKMTPESARLLELMRALQARVLEQLALDLGEAAPALLQILSYDSTTERLAVLQAGWVARGDGFAREIIALTGEALHNFVDADPELVERTQEVHDWAVQFCKEQEEKKASVQQVPMNEL
jgi:hypothetical protein